MAPSPRDRLTVVPSPAGVAPVRSASRGELGLVPADFAFCEVIEVFCSLRVLEAWAEMRSLLCDDARLESIAADGVAGADGTIEAMRFAAAGEAYVIRGYEIEALAEDAVLVQASISQQEGTVAVVTTVRSLVCGRDRLIWRSRRVRSCEEAVEMLDLHGLALGL